MGNSLGLVIERPILELLNITKDTELELTTDGRRLIVEAIPSRMSGPIAVEAAGGDEGRDRAAGIEEEGDFTDPRRTIEILDALAKEFGFSNERFRELHHAANYRPTINAHRSYCTKLIDEGSSFRPGETNERTARRMEACLRGLRVGKSWDSAIAEAVNRYSK